jgi:hypothetical protein
MAIAGAGDPAFMRLKWIALVVLMVGVKGFLLGSVAV